MASSTAYNDSHDHILRPRPMKPGNPLVLRAMSEDREGGLKPNGGADIHVPSGISSGRSTPLPADALPSVKSISSARRQIRAQNKHRMFPTIDYSARVSHFDPRSDYKDFRGFFVLFWVGLAIMVITTMLRNIKDTGYPLRVQVWSLLTANAWQLALSDMLMVTSTGISLPLQRLFRRSNGWMRWENGGMAIQSIFQAVWTVIMINWPFMLSWTWTSQVYFTLHTLVFLMKMHSYAFYNGHLSTTEHRLSALDNPDNASTAAAVRYPSSSANLDNLDLDAASKKHDDEKEALAQLREDLAVELTSPLGHVTYPQNLTSWNYIDYVMCPTLCYELEYPRTEKIRWMELFYKTLAVFGCIFLLTITSEEFIVPVLSDSAQRLAGVSSWSEQGLILAENISMLLFPFMITMLLVFLVIFEYVLGAFAEITCFADRHFYSDWWNSCDWLEFSREWNIPVHHFLRRHVYGAARPKMSRNTATFITFLISSVGHEVVMSCITKKLRGYGFLAQMSQLPIVAIQRSNFVKGRKLFNNVMFWISFILGLSVNTRLNPGLHKMKPVGLMRNQMASTSGQCASTPGHSSKSASRLHQTNATVASSILEKPSATAISCLQYIYNHLPEPLKPHVVAAATFLDRNLPRPVLEYLKDPAFISAVCVPVLLVLFSMSSGWGRRFWSSSGGGRYSPFGPGAMAGPPTVTDDDYHYLGPDDVVDAPRAGPRNDGYGFPSSGTQRGAVNASRADSANPLSPDILVLKHRGTTYPLHFPAFTIAEGQIRVSELRRLAAKETMCEDPRRIKLLYKGRILRDDTKACRDEGLKQNSELMCVVSEGPIGGGSRGSEVETSDSADEEDPYENDGPRVEVDGTIRHPESKPKRKGHRGGRRRKGRDSGSSTPVNARDSGFLAPEPLQTAGRSRSPSPMRPAPAASAPQPSAPSKPPTTAAGKLEEISSTFYTTFVPKVVQFTSNPPSDAKTRDFEYKKLSESILAQVILKLDAVETEGDEELRAKRKSLVKETQRVLNGLDEIGKGKSI